MKKVKRIWEENKVLLVLAIILIVCIAVIAIVSFSFFYGSGQSVYGNRLDITKDVKIDNKLIDDIKLSLSNDEKVTNSVVNLKGRVLYINIKFKDDVKMDDAKLVAEKTLELFNADELQVYEIEYSIMNNSYSLMGSHNTSGGESITWNNYNIVESTDKK